MRWWWLGYVRNITVLNKWLSISYPFLTFSPFSVLQRLLVWKIHFLVVLRICPDKMWELRSKTWIQHEKRDRMKYPMGIRLGQRLLKMGRINLICYLTVIKKLWKTLTFSRISLMVSTTLFMPVVVFACCLFTISTPSNASSVRLCNVLKVDSMISKADIFERRLNLKQIRIFYKETPFLTGRLSDFRKS